MAEPLEFALAGLLHDVGKFGQRAHRPGEGLDTETERVSDYLCPTGAGGRPTHLHALYTYQFVRDHFLSQTPVHVDGEVVLHLASYHHRPDTAADRTITEADHLSSGMEREGDSEARGSSTAFRRVRLRAIANEITLQREAEGTWEIGLGKLYPSHAFPQTGVAHGEDLTGEYHTLWQEFVTDWDQNQLKDSWAYFNRALSVLEQYTWCIPAATNVYPDISLFDHLKSTAAIAGCLAAETKEDQPFLLVAGDMAGIQQYLFGIRAGAGGLARRLRARSLFVSLAIENVTHFILRRLGLPMANCIMAAGGGFTLLLPNSETSLAVLAETEEQLGRWARDQMGFELYPHVGWLALGERDLYDFGAALTRLSTVLQREKLSPLQGPLQGNGGWQEDSFLLEVPPPGEEEGLCDSCQRRLGHRRPVRGREVPICDDCHADAEMGQRLVRTRYVAFTDTQGRLPFGSYLLAEDERHIPTEAYLALDLDGGSGELPNTPITGRYLARFVPRDEDRSVMEFGDIEARSSGRPSLACLKADVDNLGWVFLKGLSGDTRDRRSISRLATLSRSLELFFSGYVEQLAQEAGDIYTVYSGGDDLLLVGPWDRLLWLAVRLREDFRKYTCGNRSWSLSAGIALFRAKRPILAVAEEADHLLEAAKEARGSEIRPWPDRPAVDSNAGQEKDRLVAFGTSLPWDQALAALKQGVQLSHWLSEEALGTAQVRRLLQYSRMYQDWQRTGDVRNFQYAPMLVYDIRRNWKDAPPEALDWVRELTVRDSVGMPALRFISEYALHATGTSGEGKTAHEDR